MFKREFIDLNGASGAVYRFRHWPEGGSHLPVAGNYVFVVEDADAAKVVRAGITNDLSSVRDRERAASERRPVLIYTRLNVARATRVAEHEDLVSLHKPSSVQSSDA